MRTAQYFGGNMKKKLFLTSLLVLLCTMLMTAFAVTVSAGEITISYVDSQDPTSTTTTLDTTAYDGGKQVVNAGESFALPTTANSTYIGTEGFQLVWYTENGKTYKAGETVSFNEDTRLYRCVAKEASTSEELTDALSAGTNAVILTANIDRTSYWTFPSEKQNIVVLNGYDISFVENISGFGSNRTGKHIIGEGTISLTNPNNKLGEYYVVQCKSHSHNGVANKTTIGVDVTIDAPNHHLFQDDDGATAYTYPWVRIFGKVNVYSLGNVKNYISRAPRIDIYESADITVTGPQIFWDNAKVTVGGVTTQAANRQSLQLTIYGGTFTLPDSAVNYAFWTNDIYDSNVHVVESVAIDSSNKDIVKIYSGSFNVKLPDILIQEQGKTLQETDGVYTIVDDACTGTAHNYLLAEAYNESVSRNCVDGGIHYYRCECGSYYVDYAEPWGHDYSILETETEATPTQTGIRRVTCSICSDSYTYDYSFSPLDLELTVTVKTDNGVITGTLLSKDLYEITIVDEVGNYTCTINSIKDFVINDVTYTKNDIVIATIPSGTTNIDVGVFDSMESLKEVVLMDRANVLFIKDNFKNCPLLEKLTVGVADVEFAAGSGENAGAGIINNCPLFDTIDISKANATFNKHSFANDKIVHHLIMGEGNTYIFRERAFNHSVLEEVILPDNSNVTLELKCFAETETIKYVYVGSYCLANGSIGDDTYHKSIFGGNGYLEKVVLMEGINYVGQWSLSTKKSSQTGDTAKYKTFSDCVVYVHSETFNFHSEAFNDRANGDYILTIYSANPNITAATSTSNYIVYSGIGHAYKQDVITASTCVTQGTYGYAADGCTCGIDYRNNSFVSYSNKLTELNGVTYEPYGTEVSYLPLSDEHILGTELADIVYTNYFENGTMYYYCALCETVKVAEQEPSAAPIFSAAGYSCFEENSAGGISYTIRVNHDALEFLETNKGIELVYGLVVGAHNDGSPVVDKDTVADGVLMADMTKTEYTKLQSKLIGIDSENETTALNMCAYVILDNKVSYLSDTQTYDSAQPITLQGIKELADSQLEATVPSDEQ